MENKILIDKIKKQITFKYFYSNLLPGFVDYLMNLGWSFNDELIHSLRRAIEEHFWTDIEPEWDSQYACEWWENMDSRYFKLKKDESGVEDFNPNFIPPQRLLKFQ